MKGLAKERETMEKVEQFISMNGGDGEASYASNSSYQRGVIFYTKQRVDDTLAEVYLAIPSKCIVIADLGCCSGPNTLITVLQIMDAIGTTCLKMKQEMPNVQVFLNDLPSNDFNNIFKSLPDLYLKLKEKSKQCFVAAVPGSFYGRLFPSNSLHFAHSSYALHWLTQAPQGLIGKNGEPLNKGNIYIAETSNPIVHQMYYAQFENDFHLFLKSRSEEMVLGGGMVHTLIGSVQGGLPFTTIEFIGLTLFEMANEGLIEKWKLDMFNMPLYAPSAEEIRRVVRNEGSFSITRLECFDIAWDAAMPGEISNHETCDKNDKGKYVAKHLRATTEPLLAGAFGDVVVDELFSRVECKLAERMKALECKFHNILFSLKKMKETAL